MARPITSMNPYANPMMTPLSPSFNPFANAMTPINQMTFGNQPNGIMPGMASMNPYGIQPINVAPMNNGMNGGMNNGMNGGMNNGINGGMNNGMNGGMNNGMNGGMNNGMNGGMNGDADYNHKPSKKKSHKTKTAPQEINESFEEDKEENADVPNKWDLNKEKVDKISSIEKSMDKYRFK